MIPAFPRWRIFPWGGVSAGILLAALGAGCATTPPQKGVPRAVSTALSPVAEPVAPRDAWRLAEAYAADHLGCEVVIGRGDSMLPFYRDRTVLVLRRTAMSALRRGMTVVFTGDNGRPVAHTLLEKTSGGWRAIGAGNRDPDRTVVCSDNLVGVVVKAYAPTASIAAAVTSPDSHTALRSFDPDEPLLLRRDGAGFADDD